MMWSGGWWGPFPWMWIFPALFLVVIVLLIFRSASRPSGGWGDRAAGPTAREILDRRYANGEISREEYQQMKKDIG